MTNRLATRGNHASSNGTVPSKAGACVSRGREGLMISSLCVHDHGACTKQPRLSRARCPAGRNDAGVTTSAADDARDLQARVHATCPRMSLARAQEPHSAPSMVGPSLCACRACGRRGVRAPRRGARRVWPRVTTTLSLSPTPRTALAIMAPDVCASVHRGAASHVARCSGETGHTTHTWRPWGWWPFLMAASCVTGRNGGRG